MTTEIYWVDQPHRWRGEADIFSQSVTNLLGVLFTQGQSSDTSISISREAMFFKSSCKKMGLHLVQFNSQPLQNSYFYLLNTFL